MIARDHIAPIQPNIEISVCSSGAKTNCPNELPALMTPAAVPRSAAGMRRVTAPIKTEHKPAKPSDIDGTWLGTLDTGMGKLRVVFHIVNTEDGLIATMDSPDQGGKGIPTSSVTRNGTSLKIEAKGIGRVFDGKIAADLSSIDGTWTQGGGTLPLVLKPVKDQAEVGHTPVKLSDIDGAS